MAIKIKPQRIIVNLSKKYNKLEFDLKNYLIQNNAENEEENKE